MNKEIPVNVSYPSLTLEAGDRVRFPRSGGLYSHWATYEGDGKVVHLTNVDKLEIPTASTSLITGKASAIFEREDLHAVAGTSKAYKNNTYDRNRRPLDQETILKRTKAAVGRKVSYSALTQNCEHYTTWMRNDDFTSSQAETAGWGIFSLLMGGLIGLFTYFGNKRSQRQ